MVDVWRYYGNKKLSDVTITEEEAAADPLRDALPLPERDVVPEPLRLTVALPLGGGGTVVVPETLTLTVVLRD